MFDLASLQSEAGDEVAFFGMAHPDNDPMPYERYFPSYIEFRPPSISMRAGIRASARMFWVCTASFDMSSSGEPSAAVATLTNEQ